MNWRTFTYWRETSTGWTQAGPQAESYGDAFDAAAQIQNGRAYGADVVYVDVWTGYGWEPDRQSAPDGVATLTTRGQQALAYA